VFFLLLLLTYILVLHKRLNQSLFLSLWLLVHF